MIIILYIVIYVNGIFDMWVNAPLDSVEIEKRNSEIKQDNFNEEEYYSWLSEVEKERKKWKTTQKKRLEKKVSEYDDFNLLDKIDSSIFENVVDSEELREIGKESIKNWMLDIDKNGKKMKVYIEVSWEKRPSKLFESLINAWFSPEQALKSRLQVRTESFKAWFGDWINDPENASKIVDENGEPLLVYHGSARRFKEFDINKIGSTTGDESGFYFSSGRGVAKHYYSKETGSMLGNLKLMLGISRKYKSTVYDCFLRASNPYIYDFGGSRDDVGREELIADAKKAGHDCVVLKNIIDGPTVVQDAYVVFHPNQIKIEFR